MEQEPYIYPPVTLEDLQARVLYQDSNMLVLNKPGGLAVHAAGKERQHLGQFLDQMTFGIKTAPRLAHRLDADTTGVLVLARHEKAMKRLSKLFQSNQINKTYLALVEGEPDYEEARIYLPIDKREGKRRVWIDPEKGKPSLTDLTVVGRGQGYSLLKLKPITGRTHQLRVHCWAMKLPMVGDPIYGSGRSADKPLMLHAAAIDIPALSGTRDAVRIEAPLPQTMLDALAAVDISLPTLSASCL